MMFNKGVSVYSVLEVFRVVKVKTSIYIDKGLWEKFKKYASKKGLEASRLLEELIRDEIIDDALESILLDLASSENYEIDFEPIRTREGGVSELIRVMRDERSSSLP